MAIVLYTPESCASPSEEEGVDAISWGRRINVLARMFLIHRLARSDFVKTRKTLFVLASLYVHRRSSAQLENASITMHAQAMKHREDYSAQFAHASWTIHQVITSPLCCHKICMVLTVALALELVLSTQDRDLDPSDEIPGSSRWRLKDSRRTEEVGTRDHLCGKSVLAILMTER